MADVDLINRDPNNINDHLQCQFEDVLAEPEGTHSIDCVWKLSFSCFNCWKSCCYKLVTTLCGICIAAGWGCEFAMISFYHIWNFTPCFKVLDMNCGCCKKFYARCIDCCIDPYCRACGEFWHHFSKK